MAVSISENDLGHVVAQFYERLRADNLLGPVFNAAIGNWPEQLDKLQDFWSSVMLTTGRYKGQPMAAHLAHAQAMTPERFERWLDLWKETTDALLCPQDAETMQRKAGNIAESLSLGIAFQQHASSSSGELLAGIRMAGEATR